MLFAQIKENRTFQKGGRQDSICGYHTALLVVIPTILIGLLQQAHFSAQRDNPLIQSFDKVDAGCMLNACVQEMVHKEKRDLTNRRRHFASESKYTEESEGSIFTIAPSLSVLSHFDTYKHDKLSVPPQIERERKYFWRFAGNNGKDVP